MGGLRASWSGVYNRLPCNGLLRRPPVEGGRQTIFHVSVATGFPNGLLNASTSHQARDAAVPESHPTQPRRPPGVGA